MSLIMGQQPGRKIRERRPLPMFGRMLFIFKLECQEGDE